MKLFIYIASIIVIIFIVYVYTAFNGTPWEKAAFRKQSIEYIDQKYSMVFPLKSVSFSFKNAKYSTYFYLDDTKSESFSVYSTMQGLRDNYFIKKWEAEVKAKLKPVIERHFDADTDHFFEIDINDVTEEKQIIEAMPSYDEVQERIHPYTALLIRVNRKFDEQEDVAKLQHFLEEMNRIHMNVQILSVIYRSPKDDFDTRIEFEIPSEFGETYQVDRIIEYRIR